MNIKRPEINMKYLSYEYGEVLRLIDKRLQEKGSGIYNRDVANTYECCRLLRFVDKRRSFKRRPSGAGGNIRQSPKF